MAPGQDALLSLRELSEPGQVVALCTDGITEARNDSGEQFGRERLEQGLQRRASQHASSILEGVMRDVSNFRGPAPEKDGVTLVVLKRAP